MKSRKNEIILSGILLSGIVAFGINEFVYNGTPVMRVLMGVSFLLAVSLPFVLYILFVTRRERNHLLDRIYVNRVTGLPNRERLRVDASHAQAILFLINIDSFKEFNDFYGYRIGDQIILEMASRLAALIRERKDPVLRQGILYKLESDEFGILIAHPFGRGEVIRAAERLVLTLNNNPFRPEGHELPVSVTIGIAFGEKLDHPSGDPERRTPGILSRADLALKRARKLKHHFQIFEDSFSPPETFEENIRWTRKIRESIQKERVACFFQPIVNNRTSQIEKFECLIRIIDDNGNILYPSHFLKISKRSRLYPELTKIVLERAFREAASNTTAGFSINISVEDILNTETVECIYTILEENAGTASRICFEILETETIESLVPVKHFLTKIREYGCEVALDDFGFGYSNFSYLLELDIDYIKLDSTLIKNIHTNNNAYLISETIVSFCTKLGIRTIAEYVHSRDVFNVVRELGIDYSQGFYLGAPGERTEGVVLGASVIG